MNRVELLAPAGDINRGKIALDYGADAIYFGAKVYSLRARASNFDYEDVKHMIEYAHKNSKKAYIVANILCHNHFLNGLDDFIKRICSYKPDGFIVADPAVIKAIRKIDKKVEIHISTQQSVTNSKAALFWKRNGVTRIVLAREVSYDELKNMIINLANKIDLEYFVHGALCIAYSGRCMLSNNYCLRDANIGGCAQSCRWRYTLYDENNQYSKSFSMSAKDMQQISNLEKILELGIKSMKIEGRMKSEHYIATVCKVYADAINEYYSTHKIKDKNEYLNDLTKVENRETANGWFNGHPDYHSMLDNDIAKNVNQIYAFIINKKINDDSYIITSKNYFRIDELFEVISPRIPKFNIRLKSIEDKNGVKYITINQPQKTFKIILNKPINIIPNSIVRIVPLK